MSKSVLPPVEVSRGSTGAFVSDFVSFSETYADQPHIPGEVFSFPMVQQQDGFKFVQAIVIPFPDDAEESRDYGMFEAICITVHVDTTSGYSISKETDISADLKKNLAKWVVNGDDLRNMNILSYEVTGSSDAGSIISVTLICDVYEYRDWLGDVVKSPFLDEVWNKHMESIITEGVCYVHDKVPVTLRDSLRSRVEDFAKNTAVDFHPKSNDIVRDFVHPALYPYIKGTSKTIPQFTPVALNEKSDFWGRPYEDSKYQWLPAPFQISETGECSILEYINNLDRKRFPQLYKDLECLFEVFLPYFEEVWSYAKAITFFKGEDLGLDESGVINPLAKEPVSFKGRELQVITKIVEYKLKPGQKYEGVWHAEGMSHENIVMTGIYFLSRDSDIEGGDLRFKRAFTEDERYHVFWEVPQQRPFLVDKTAGEGFVPLGRFPTEEGYLLVFPNCHIHQIAKMVNTSSTKSSSRQIVVFFVVNPEKKIISTREVPPQQNVISLSDAKAYRLELMLERKYNKEKLNVRDIELCEH